MTKVFAALALFAFAHGVNAAPAAVHGCEGLDSIGNLVDDVRPFANRNIRVAYVTTEEPAASPDHLLIFVSEEPIGLKCFAVSHTAEGRGFSGINFAKTRSSYDPKKGLLITVPVSLYDGNISKPAGNVKIRVNRANGQSTVTIED